MKEEEVAHPLAVVVGNCECGLGVCVLPGRMSLSTP